MAFPTIEAYRASLEEATQFPEVSDMKEHGYIAVALLRKEAEEGSIKAMRELANKFFLGIGIEKDQDEGIYWLGQLYENSIPMDPFASLLLRGLERQIYGYRKKDKIIAEGLFLRAAEKGSILALHFLAGMYLTGNGVERSREKAIAYYQRAVALKDPQAQVALERLTKQQYSSNQPF